MVFVVRLSVYHAMKMWFCSPGMERYRYWEQDFAVKDIREKHISFCISGGRLNIKMSFCQYRDPQANALIQVEYGTAERLTDVRSVILGTILNFRISLCVTSGHCGIPMGTHYFKLRYMGQFGMRRASGCLLRQHYVKTSRRRFLCNKDLIITLCVRRDNEKYANYEDDCINDNWRNILSSVHVWKYPSGKTTELWGKKVPYTHTDRYTVYNQ